MDDLNFRLATAKDRATLHLIREAAFAPVFASFRALVGDRMTSAFAGAEAEQAALLDGLLTADNAELWVVELMGQPIGFGAVLFHEARSVGEIGLNAVHPDYAGDGVGTALYGHLLERMRARGMTVAEVGTGGDASHAPARRAYEKAGFHQRIPSVVLYRPL